MSKFIPILFSTLMVQAILEGRKTMTRRIIKPQPEHKQLHEYMGKTVYDGEHRMWCYKTLVLENIWDFPGNDDRKALAGLCPYGSIGDVLWVRETFAPVDTFPEPDCFGKYLYKANGDTPPTWKPSLFMPKDACRIFLEITDIKVERLQDISEEDAIKEGVEKWADGFDYKAYGKHAGRYTHAVDSFRSLWYHINGEESYNSDPFVWCISFKRIDKPENFI